jgi:hypothetical protein
VRGMILSVKVIRDFVKGLKPTTMVSFENGGMVILKPKETRGSKKVLDYNEVRKMVRKGMKPADVAKRLGVTRQAINHVLHHSED